MTDQEKSRVLYYAIPLTENEHKVLEAIHEAFSEDDDIHAEDLEVESLDSVDVEDIFEDLREKGILEDESQYTDRGYTIANVSNDKTVIFAMKNHTLAVIS